MKDEPTFAPVAALMGDPARANMLAALLDGRALTASELAVVAGVSLPTASGHIAKLEAAGLLVGIRQGRHRYLRLSADDVVHTIDSLMLLAERTGVRRVRTGPREPALRTARVCYDHLAGSRGVQLLASLRARSLVEQCGEGLGLTADGERFVATLGLDLPALTAKRRALCVACLDWSERREHLAGAVGAGLLSVILHRGWARREAGSRAVHFSRAGAKSFDRAFPI